MAALLVGSLVGAGLTMAAVGPAAPGTAGAAPGADAGQGDLATVAQFGNESAFQQYVERGRSLGYGVRFQGAEMTADTASGGDGGAASGAPQREQPQATQTVAQTEAPMETVAEATADGSDGPDRVGRTNVQVAALDEPDLVKTDGEHFYYAPQFRGYHEPRPGDRPWQGDSARPQPPQPAPETHVVDVDDPANPEAIANVDDSGQLLQTGDRLLVLGDEAITAYDVSDPENPDEVWSERLEAHLVTARERNGTVYLVTRTHVGGSPCPIEPVDDVSIPCGEVYRPDAQVRVDATYTAISLDAGDGEVRDSVSFVGTGQHSAVYMSTESLYVTYTSRTDRASLLADFLTEEFEPTPERVEERIAELRSYDISPESRQREMHRAVSNWLDSVPDDQRRDIERNLSEGLSAYIAAHQRELTRTGVVQVDVTDADMSVAETGTVPGRPLNQFSLSEHAGTLRIATTVPGAGDAQSANDLYVLDRDSLSTIGSVTDMGEGQEIYAVRYVGETAYLVTFRQVDPLHVVDLTDPTEPVERGTLKLPGFSSYLHPIDDDHVLGIGEEDGQVKTVLFDVSDPENPTIADDEILDSRWSAVSQSHHAFTIDRRHGVFFLPTGRDGLVVDYTNGSLSVEYRVDTVGTPERARYVDDYLYVFAGTEIAVVDETTWDRVDTLDLEGED
jgi:uncharacterized secreted protein with C-terminal beta-propeller domain